MLFNALVVVVPLAEVVAVGASGRLHALFLSAKPLPGDRHRQQLFAHEAFRHGDSIAREAGKVNGTCRIGLDLREYYRYN